MSIDTNMSAATEYSDLMSNGFQDSKTEKLNEDGGGLKVKREEKLACWGVLQTVTLFGFLGSVIAYAMRVNLSVTIVAMKEEFQWESTTQGIILASFFYGYIFTNLAGGTAADYFGGRTVVGTSIVIVAILTLLTPVVAQTSTPLFIALRVLQGLSQGIMFPAMNSLIASWAPPAVRQKTSMRVYTGIHFGTVVTLPLSGWLCSIDLLGGWPLVFYSIGGCGLLVGILFLVIVKDDPRQHKTISEVELKFLMDGSQKDVLDAEGNSTQKVSVPWKGIFTNKIFWIIALAHMGNDWGFYMLLTELPTYLDEILKFDVASNGFIASLPYLGSWIFGIIYSIVLDILLKKEKISIVTARKMSMGIGSYGPAIAMTLLCFTGYNAKIAVLVLVIGGTLNSAVYSGFPCSLADIGPKFAGTLLGLTNTMSTIPGFLAPMMTGALTHGSDSLWGWRIVFITTVVIYLISVTPYVCSVTADVQPFNEVKTDTKDSLEKGTKKDDKGDGKYLLPDNS